MIGEELMSGILQVWKNKCKKKKKKGNKYQWFCFNLGKFGYEIRYLIQFILGVLFKSSLLD